VQWQWADKSTGLLSAEHCDGAVFVPFRADTIPTESTLCAKGGVAGAVGGVVSKVLNFFSPSKQEPAAPAPSSPLKPVH
jgi:hypothetical protein